MTATYKPRDFHLTWHDRLTVKVPEGQLNDVTVERFEVTADSLENFFLAQERRSCRPGTYTRLVRNGTLWMSDTTAERQDHLEVLRQIADPDTRRVLINGLGLGMIVAGALSFDHVEHVDVVEIDPTVCELIGAFYAEDPRVTIHQADAYTVKWPTGMRWDVAWHDIWPNLSTDDLESMGRLHRRYGRRVRWQGSWGRDVLEARRARDRRGGWY